MKKISLLFVSILILFACQTEKQPDLATPQLSFFIGDVKVDDQNARLGTKLVNNSIITTGDKSLAEVKLGTSTAFQVRENAIASIVNKDGNWEVHAQQGAILNLVQRGTVYKHRGPSAVIAVRGTIFYVNCYDDSTQYICTCNGSIEISDGIQTKDVSASHHEPYLIKKTENGIIFEPAPMKEHDDLEIFEFMYRVGDSK